GDGELVQRVALHDMILGELRDWCRDLNALPVLRLGHQVVLRNGGDAARATRVPGISLGATDWMLVDLEPGPSRSDGPDAGEDWKPVEVIRVLREQGFQVLVSSPERYAYPGGVDPVRVLRSWRMEGTAFQVDGGSLQGHNGATASALAWRFMVEGLVDVVASNHRGNVRPHHLGPATRLVAFRVSPSEAMRLVADNPQAILDDRPVEALDRAYRKPEGISPRSRERAQELRTPEPAA
ncbi:MAG: CpsB/CapC family capsule biosynthesis tyrosine phosphatase, partial [Longimicrobiales bacterium]